MTKCICEYGIGRPGVVSHSLVCEEYTAAEERIDHSEKQLITMTTRWESARAYIKLLEKVRRKAVIYTEESYKPVGTNDRKRFNALVKAIAKCDAAP